MWVRPSPNVRWRQSLWTSITESSHLCDDGATVPACVTRLRSVNGAVWEAPGYHDIVLNAGLNTITLLQSLLPVTASLSPPTFPAPGFPAPPSSSGNCSSLYLLRLPTQVMAVRKGLLCPSVSLLGLIAILLGSLCAQGFTFSGHSRYML